MPAEPQQSGRGVTKAAARRSIDADIARLCQRQRHLIRLDQLHRVGLTSSGVARRVERHRLHRVHRGVFAVHPPPFRPDQLLLAAIFACGPGSVASDLAAANLLGMTDRRPRLPHVTNGGGIGRAIRGIVVHERTLAAHDVVIHQGIPCTSPARTIFDCAGSSSIGELEHLLMAADSGRPGLDRTRLQALVDEGRGRRGIRKLRLLIGEGPQETRSVNERRLLSICRQFEVPEPMVNHRIEVGGRIFYADFCWPDLRLIVEADSWRWHGGRIASESDADRDQLLSVAGWRVVHFTRDQIARSRRRTGLRLVALTSSHPSSRS